MVAVSRLCVASWGRLGEAILCPSVQCGAVSRRRNAMASATENPAVGRGASPPGRWINPKRRAARAARQGSTGMREPAGRKLGLEMEMPVVRRGSGASHAAYPLSRDAGGYQAGRGDAAARLAHLGCRAVRRWGRWAKAASTTATTCWKPHSPPWPEKAGSSSGPAGRRHTYRVAGRARCPGRGRRDGAERRRASRGHPGHRSVFADSCAASIWLPSWRATVGGCIAPASTPRHRTVPARRYRSPGRRARLNVMLALAPAPHRAVRQQPAAGWARNRAEARTA